jgi:hypothetical protein
MSASADPHQVSTLLRISRELDIVGDVTVTVATPSDLLAWAYTLPTPSIWAWRAADSHHRYIHLSATSHRNPVHGRITAVLSGDDHHHFWTALLPQGDLPPGGEELLPLRALVTAWSTATLEPESAVQTSTASAPGSLTPPETDPDDAL